MSEEKTPIATEKPEGELATGETKAIETVSQEKPKAEKKKKTAKPSKPKATPEKEAFKPKWEHPSELENATNEELAEYLGLETKSEYDHNDRQQLWEDARAKFLAELSASR